MSEVTAAVLNCGAIREYFGDCRSIRLDQRVDQRYEYFYSFFRLINVFLRSVIVTSKVRCFHSLLVCVYGVFRFRFHRVKDDYSGCIRTIKGVQRILPTTREGFLAVVGPAMCGLVIEVLMFLRILRVLNVRFKELFISSKFFRFGAL